MSLHARIKVRMPSDRFPEDQFPARYDEDGKEVNADSIVLRRWGSNGDGKVLIESTLGRLLLNEAFPPGFPYQDAVMKKRAESEGIKSLLIMCDGEGRLGDPDAAMRGAAVDNHKKWVEAARTLGCAMIRVNAASEGAYDEQLALAADGLRRLCEFADPYGLDVVVENHGGLSSNGEWLAGVMRRVDHPRCGTLPDFGNFYEYDRYQGVADLMPYAKAVSAKSHGFDREGNESGKDYRRLMKIVTDAGYHSWVGIEYEGKTLSEHDGILATRQLLERVSRELSAGASATGRGA